MTSLDTCIYNVHRRNGKIAILDTTSKIIETIADTCIAVRVRMLNRVITNLYDNALRPLGLKASQLNILVITGKLGLAAPAKVCEILQLDTSTLSRNVERMRAKRWLEVVACEDARAQPFRLTAEGERLLKKAAPAWERAQQQAVEFIGQSGLTVLTKMAEKLGMVQSGS